MDEEKSVTLRLPADLHVWLAAEAEHVRRSLNSELAYRLEGERPATDADTASQRQRTRVLRRAPQEPDSLPV